MKPTDGAIPFPVVYYDGESETRLGILMVHPTTNIKTLISQKIKVSHQISFLFFSPKKEVTGKPLSPHVKVKFGKLPRNGGEYYLYVKRFSGYNKSLVKNKKLMPLPLRRDGAEDGTKFNGFQMKLAAAPSTLEHAKMEKKVLNLRNESETFLKSTERKRGAVTIESLRRELPNSNDGGVSGGAACKECLLAWLRKTAVDFHLFLNDEVVVGFKTLAGPSGGAMKKNWVGR